MMGKQTRQAKQQAASKKFMTGMDHKVRKSDHFTVSRAKKLEQVEFLKKRALQDSTTGAPAAKDARVKKQPNMD